MKKSEAIRLVQVERTHQIHYDCDNVELLREVTGKNWSNIRGFYLKNKAADEPFCNLKIIKISEITKEDNTERVIEVLRNGVWIPRVLLMFKHNHAICWNYAETIEESKNVSNATVWDEWREIQPKVELTNDEFEKLVGCKFENFKIKE